MKTNQNYQSLKPSYLFSDIAKKVADYKTANPTADVIRLGIGDVTLPLARPVVAAMSAAVAEMGAAESFRGYPPEGGYDFLREKIAKYYSTKGVELEPSEIFVSDGAKSDIANILDLFDKDNVVLVPDPVYPVYVDTNIMDGREIRYMRGSAENGFLPMPQDAPEADIIYLCSPNNPTGSAYNREQLAEWVRYANARGAVILFDAAYEAFAEGELPTSIFQISGAETCAIEFCSFSKTAGFTGTRCGWTVAPHALPQGLNAMWLRRHATKFNGVPYVVQRGAAAVFAESGGLCEEIKTNIEYYKANARIIMAAMDKLGIKYFGGKNSPYIWLEVPQGLSSWEYFDYLLDEFNIVGTPGAGFGSAGEGYFRLTAFGSRENTEKAMKRLTV